MSVPKLDPRVNLDRVYEYEEYLQMRERFSRRKRAWYEFVPPKGHHGRRRMPAIRMLPYKLAVAAGLIVMLGCLGAMSMVRADTARMEYARQELTDDLAGLDQSLHESTAAIVAAKGEVFTDGSSAVEPVGYPAETDYVVLTNIPDASGKSLVSQLYPLSREVLKVEP